MMERREREALDRALTGNHGEDSVPEPEYDCVCSYPFGPHALHCVEFNATRQKERKPELCRQCRVRRAETTYMGDWPVCNRCLRELSQ